MSPDDLSRPRVVLFVMTAADYVSLVALHPEPWRSSFAPRWDAAFSFTSTGFWFAKSPGRTVGYDPFTDVRLEGGPLAAACAEGRRLSPSGGRLYVDRTGVFLADGGFRRVVTFILTGPGAEPSEDAGIA